MAARRSRTPSPAQRAQWATDRQDKLADLQQRIVAEVATLTDGEQWRRWLGFAAHFHDYSFLNTVAIWMQRPDATWVAGFERWKKLGRHVRKGEHGIAILAPITGRADTPDATTPADEPDPLDASVPAAAVSRPTDPDAQPNTDMGVPPAADAGPAARVLRGFRVVHVFDITQTDGDGPQAPPRPARADTDVELLRGQAPTGLWDALVAVATDRGYTVQRGDCGETNGYTDFDDRVIRVRADVDDAQAAKTMAHEIGHVLLHTSEDFGWGTSAGCRGRQEVEAESVAYLVAAHYGLDTSRYTFGYVTEWAQRAATIEKQSPEDIVRATGQRVVSTAFTITEATDTHLGLAEPQPSPKLAARVAAGAAATSSLRAAISLATVDDAAVPASQAKQPALFDTTAASTAGDSPPAQLPSRTARAFGPLRHLNAAATPAGSPPPATPGAAPQLGRRR